MAEGWKQVLEDILNSLRGEETKKIEDESAPNAILSHEEKSFKASPAEEEIIQIEDETADALYAEIQTEIAQDPKVVATSAPSEEAVDEASKSLSELSTEATSFRSLEAALRTRLRQRRWRVGLYVVLALLATGGLWMLGGNRLWERWRAPRPPEPEVVVTFDGGEITIADIEAHLELLIPQEFREAVNSPETILFVVEDMVLDELVRRWAAERNPDSDESFRHSMQHITEELNLESFEVELHEGAIPVPESEIQAYYNANRALFGDQSLGAVREQIRQFLVAEREQSYMQDYLGQLKTNASITRNYNLLEVPEPSEDDLRRFYEDNQDLLALPRFVTVDELEFPIVSEEAIARTNADDALLKIRSGRSFDEVVQDVSGALLSNGVTFPEGVLDPAWDAAVFNLTFGETSSVFRAGESFFIVRLGETQPARTQSLDEARELILPVVMQQKRDEWFQLNASKTLFTLKGKQYTVGQFFQEYLELPSGIQAQFLGTEGMTNLAELLIDRLVILADTTDRLLDVKNEPLVEEARLQVLREMMDQEEVDDKLEVTDDEMQQFYDENREFMALPPQARIRYIRIGLGSSEDEVRRAVERADEAYRKLVPGIFQSGEEFSVIAQTYSEDPETAVNGGEYPGWIGESDDILAEIELHPFHEVVLTMEEGEISPPFEFGGSLYIVEVIERTDPETLTLEEAKSYIQEILTHQKHDELAAQLQLTLFEESNVVIYSTTLEAYFESLFASFPSEQIP